MAYTAEQKVETIECAKQHGLRAAARKFGMSQSTVKTWVDEAGKGETFGAVPALVETHVVGGDQHVEGLPALATVAYIDPTNVLRAQALAQVYSARRRAELRVKLADAAVHVADQLIACDNGRDADSWGRALTAVTTLLRLEAGQVGSLKGVVEIREQLDAEQTQPQAQAAGPVFTDLTVPIEARIAPEDEDDEGLDEG